MQRQPIIIGGGFFDCEDDPLDLSQSGYDPIGGRVREDHDAIGWIVF
ncbi:MAG: hypothetical protein ACXWAV_03630 [Chthoniobacterales bacterium]